MDYFYSDKYINQLAAPVNVFLVRFDASDSSHPTTYYPTFDQNTQNYYFRVDIDSIIYLQIPMLNDINLTNVNNYGLAQDLTSSALAEKWPTTKAIYNYLKQPK